ncbi:MAG: hypothetical protein ABJL67_03370 [Sulfitobacter sp.]
MSFQPTFPGLFGPAKVSKALPNAPTQTQPATQKQIAYAMTLALRHKAKLPDGITADRAALSKWIDANKAPVPKGKFGNYPSSKQVAFAERIATLKRNPVPPECFQDRTLMSRWIDSNKPR